MKTSILIFLLSFFVNASAAEIKYFYLNETVEAFISKIKLAHKDGSLDGNALKKHLLKQLELCKQSENLLLEFDLITAPTNAGVFIKDLVNITTKNIARRLEAQTLFDDIDQKHTRKFVSKCQKIVNDKEKKKPSEKEIRSQAISEVINLTTEHLEKLTF